MNSFFKKYYVFLGIIASAKNKTVLLLFMKGWVELMDYRVYSRVVISIIFIVPLLLIPANSPGQTPDCDYDKNAPSMEHARNSFKALNHICAEAEIIDFINAKAPNLKSKADAHVLLAAVYYGMLKDSQSKRVKVVEQFKQAFRVLRIGRANLISGRPNSRI